MCSALVVIPCSDIWKAEAAAAKIMAEAVKAAEKNLKEELKTLDKTDRQGLSPHLQRYSAVLSVAWRYVLICFLP